MSTLSQIVCKLSLVHRSIHRFHVRHIKRHRPQVEIGAPQSTLVSSTVPCRFSAIHRAWSNLELHGGKQFRRTAIVRVLKIVEGISGSSHEA